MAGGLKHKVLSGIFWQGLGNIGGKGLNFLVSVILARLLAPEDFGSVALLMIFISIGEVFVDSGFSNALIQKKDADDIDCSSVFYINILISAALYLGFFVAAPWIARFYRNPDLTLWFRCLALGTVIRSLSLVQSALLNKRMLFRFAFQISLGALIVSGTVGIVMAYRGFGVWALIAQQLTNAALTGLLLWLLVRWRPRAVFAWDRLRTLFRFGSKLLATSLLDSVFNNLFGMIVGRLFNVSTLAYYNRGRQIPATGMSVINSTIGSVVFPAFSEIQNDRPRMFRMARKSLKVTMFFVCPAMGALALLARPLVLALLTEKWLPSVVFLRLSCLIFVVWPLHTLNLQVIVACGRSDIMLILEFIKKVQTVAVLLLSYPFGVETMVAAMAVNGMLCAVENALPNRKLIGYSPLTQLGDLLPFLLWSGIAAVPVALAASFRSPGSPWLRFFAGLLLYGAFYFAGNLLTRSIPAEISELGRRVRGVHHAG